LINEPEVLLLDEPTNGLDARLRDTFYRHFQTLRERLKIPLLLVTHDLDECLRLAEHVFYMEAGRIVYSGTGHELLNKPASIAMARSLGVYSCIPAEITALDPGRNLSRIAASGLVVEAPYLPGHLIGDHGHLCIRNSEIALAEGSPRGANLFPVSVIATAPSAEGVRLELEHQLSITLSHHRWLALERPAEIVIHIPSSAAHFLP
jgi:molybdate transport system ATP-binding protein